MNENNAKKYIIIALVIAILAFLITVVVLFVKFKNNLNIVDENTKVRFEKDKNFLGEKEKDQTGRTREEILITNHAKENAGKVLDKVNLRKLDFSKYAQLQFSKPSKLNTVVNIKFSNSEKIVKIKLFDDLAPVAVSQFITGLKQKRWQNQIASLATFTDISFNFDLPNFPEMFALESDEDINFSLLPYKGALMKRNSKEPTSTFYIINENHINNNEEIVSNRNWNESLKNEMIKREGRLEANYLEAVCFGQVIEGMDILDEIKQYYIKNRNDILNNKMSVIYIKDLEIIERKQ